MSHNHRKLLTTQEVASFLHVSRRTVFKYCKEGKLACYRVARKLLIDEKEVERFLAARAVIVSGKEPKRCVSEAAQQKATKLLWGL